MPKGKIVALLILLLPLYCISQSNGRVPLTAILEQITSTHGTKFSYIDNDISLYSLIPPDKKLTLKQAIAYIESNTRLKFDVRSLNNYIIYSTVNAQKPLCGYVLDANTGNTIEGATIILPDKFPAGTTDAKGYFILPAVQGKIYIGSMGYSMTEINAA